MQSRNWPRVAAVATLATAVKTRNTFHISCRTQLEGQELFSCSFWLSTPDLFPHAGVCKLTWVFSKPTFLRKNLRLRFTYCAASPRRKATRRKISAGHNNGTL